MSHKEGVYSDSLSAIMSAREEHLYLLSLKKNNVEHEIININTMTRKATTLRSVSLEVEQEKQSRNKKMVIKSARIV